METVAFASIVCTIFRYSRNTSPQIESRGESGGSDVLLEVEEGRVGAKKSLPEE